jgi:RNA polymerase sporulation-specific sigma factor
MLNILYKLKNLFHKVGELFYIGSTDKLPPPLSKEEEEYYVTLAEDGDNFARDKLIEHNLRLVVFLAKKYENTGVDLEDLVSIGTIGLMKGVKTFSSDKNIKLATYCSRCIDNEILMYFRSTKKLNCEVYLEETIGKDKDDNTVTLQEVLESEGKSIEEQVDLKLKIKKMYIKMKETLKDRELEILTMRFGLDGKKPKTQEQIANKIGISRSYV